MSKIDLSKAKVGDKFRLVTNKIVTYICNNEYDGELWHRVMFEDGRELDIDDMWIEENLVEQVFDDEKDTTDREIVEAMNQAIKDIPEKAAEREKELQRRQEVVELADRIFFSERGSAYSFKDCIEVAEYSVNMINQYLKEGKL